MLHGMIKVQPLSCPFEPIIGQAPDPGGSVGNHQRSGSLPQPSPQGLRVQLIAQGIDAFAGRDKTPLTDDRTASSSPTSLVKPETGAGVDPMPSLWFPAALTQPLGSAPIVALSNIPSIDLDNHLVGFQAQFRLDRCPLAQPGLLIAARA